MGDISKLLGIGLGLGMFVLGISIGYSFLTMANTDEWDPLLLFIIPICFVIGGIACILLTLKSAGVKIGG